MATHRIRKSLLALGVQLWLATTALGQAEDDYARVHARGQSNLVSQTLKDLEARLDPPS